MDWVRQGELGEAGWRVESSTRWGVCFTGEFSRFVCVHVHTHALEQFALGLWDNSLT